MSKPEILIIDDEEQIRKLLDITLRANNYSVTQGATAKEGIIMASNHPPDLIILDLGLPDKDGLTVLYINSVGTKQRRNNYKGPRHGGQ